jgi:hypothetical protein
MLIRTLFPSLSLSLSLFLFLFLSRNDLSPAIGRCRRGSRHKSPEGPRNRKLVSKPHTQHNTTQHTTQQNNKTTKHDRHPGPSPAKTSEVESFPRPNVGQFRSSTRRAHPSAAIPSFSHADNPMICAPPHADWAALSLSSGRSDDPRRESPTGPNGSGCMTQEWNTVVVR